LPRERKGRWGKKASRGGGHWLVVSVPSVRGGGSTQRREERRGERGGEETDAVFQILKLGQDSVVGNVRKLGSIEKQNKKNERATPDIERRGDVGQRYESQRVIV